VGQFRYWTEPEDRLLVILRDVVNMPWAEIGEWLERTPGSARVHYQDCSHRINRSITTRATTNATT
jgi:hypothetical protein